MNVFRMITGKNCVEDENKKITDSLCRVNHGDRNPIIFKITPGWTTLAGVVSNLWRYSFAHVVVVTVYNLALVSLRVSYWFNLRPGRLLGRPELPARPRGMHHLW